MKLLLALIFSFSVPATATVYVIAYDELTGAMGRAVTSSGPAYSDDRVSQARRHRVAIIGNSGLGFCRRATPYRFIDLGYSPKEIALGLAQQCDRAQPYYRLAIVNSRGDVYLHMGPQGCRSGECVAISGHQMGILGGGLEPGVGAVAFAYYNSLPKEMPLECRLLNTLKKIIQAGGQRVRLKVANIVVSYPDRSEETLWDVDARQEERLMPKLEGLMQSTGVHCPEI